MGRAWSQMAVPLSLTYIPADLGRKLRQKPSWVAWTPARDGAAAAESGPSQEEPGIALNRETPSQPP